VEIQQQGLGRLLWVYLRLLLTRQAINRIVHDSSQAADDSVAINERIDTLKTQLEAPLAEDLRKSLTGQIEILQQRLERRKEARQKLAFLNAELTRIQEQVELVREQAVLSADPETLSERIDHITATLGGTTQWIADQQKIYGAVEDLVTEPPPLQIANDE
jgi:predicted  nucleic acid-binding Zn-ribbon protein